MYVDHLELFVTVLIFEETLAVLSLGNLCGYSRRCENCPTWQKHLMQHGEQCADGSPNRFFQLECKYVFSIVTGRIRLMILRHVQHQHDFEVQIFSYKMLQRCQEDLDTDGFTLSV